MFVQQFAVGAVIGLSVPDVTVTAINVSGGALGVTQHVMFGFTGSITSVKTGASAACWASAVKVPAATPTFPLVDGLRYGYSMLCRSVNGVDKAQTAIAQNAEFIGLIQGINQASVRVLTASTAIPQYGMCWPVANQAYLATGPVADRPAAGTQYKAMTMEGWTAPGVVATEVKTVMFDGLTPMGVE